MIAFTSDFISQILWKYNHDDGLSTYVKGHLSTFDGTILDSEGEEVSDTCKYVSAYTGNSARPLNKSYCYHVTVLPMAILHC